MRGAYSTNSAGEKGLTTRHWRVKNMAWRVNVKIHSPNWRVDFLILRMHIWNFHDKKGSKSISFKTENSKIPPERLDTSLIERAQDGGHADTKINQLHGAKSSVLLYRMFLFIDPCSTSSQGRIF